MMDHDLPLDKEDHAALAAEDDAAPTGTGFQPNRTARQIIAKLEKAGFTVKVPSAPHGSAWELILDKSGTPWFGVLYVSRWKGRALRASITWHPPGQAYETRKPEGPANIRFVIAQVTPHGWAVGDRLTTSPPPAPPTP
ncbi:hypothetical protein [Nonomuraea sp. SYSU D8015]|uniref:hypothetical protein n=1 Tax=Nonomuraea sp. SYSU D8015 TaxID=2593644 RepID=UPI001660DFDC|nr:hypothetical protein [Nonomuraea sp. SYSU D8015]